ncbi:MAG TPA: DUF2807 domain-containing protein [Flavisolibacter sp.]|jgi:hypothetical protein|nr:DUF2807 domain-containing protein [Flavisolibacter sp.]
MYKLLLGITLTFLLVACKKEPSLPPATGEKTFALTNFTKIHAGESFAVTVKQGAAFSIRATGRSEDLADLEASIEQGNMLSFRYKETNANRSKVEIEVVLPLLIYIHLRDAATGSISGFGQQTNAVKIVLADMARCTVDQLPELVDVFLSANSVLTLSGTAPDLIASLLGNAKLHAYNASFADADVYTAAKATAQVKVQNSLAAFASGDSRIYYKGSPASLAVEESETAKVIKE